jgi:hypothetical protein
MVFIISTPAKRCSALRNNPKPSVRPAGTWCLSLNLYKQACAKQTAQVWLARSAAKLQDRRMADEVENHTLRLLQEMRAEMREGQAEMRSELAATRNELAATRTEMREGFAEVRQRLSIVEGSLGKVIDAVTEIAKVQEKHSVVLIELAESDRIASARLNALEARLGRIESKSGLALQ